MKNGELKIEKGIPIPGRRGPRGKGYTVILRSLKKGESVFLPKCKRASELATRTIGAGNYATRQERGGSRVWRIK